MLTNDKSPLHRLIFPWWQSRENPPAGSDPQTMREALFAAALQEILDRHALRRAYCPTLDHRFKWAVQHLEVLEGTRRRPDPDIQLNASLKFEPTPFLSRQDLAAGAA